MESKKMFVTIRPTISMFGFVAGILPAVAFPLIVQAQQEADASFNARVERPAYSNDGPRVLLCPSGERV